MEFDYTNEQSFYCRPLRLDSSKHPKRMPIPDESRHVRTAFLPPMSGLAATETRIDQDAVNIRIGERCTAEVLRNLCLRVVEKEPDRWNLLVERIRVLFEVDFDEPRYVEGRGEITMGYRKHDSVLNLSPSGRGLQQILLILAYIYANPGAVILLDEPDAHLELLRQRHIYNMITGIAGDNGNQIIATSHSDVLLNEAAEKDPVIAFVEKPHSIVGKKSQHVSNALTKIGFDNTTRLSRPAGYSMSKVQPTLRY